VKSNQNGSGPHLLDLGERELEGGIDPVEDLAPPHEVGAVHHPDARRRREVLNELFETPPRETV
jgi:hypothetical protein